MTRPAIRSQRAALAREAASEYVLDIAAGLLEVAPNRFIATTLYNGQFPGPVLRLRQGSPVTIEVHNHTETRSRSSLTPCGPILPAGTSMDIPRWPDADV